MSGWPPPTLSPAGPFAEPVAILAWVLFAMAAGIVIIVTTAMLLALFGSDRWRRRLRDPFAVFVGGLLFPILILTCLLTYGLALTGQLSAAPGDAELRIRITGEQWWWRVAYLNGEGEVLHTANEVHIPVGRSVTVELDSADVIHSFWVPQLAGKLDMIPGRRNVLRLQADAAGVYGGSCAEYCGGAHAFMSLLVIAVEPELFDAWHAAQLRPAGAPVDPLRLRGSEVFEQQGCGACHTIRGTDARGLLGPDLTHIGSRRMLGAGLYPINRGTLAGWVSDAQTLKPGNKMPSFDTLTGRDLHALAAYLEGLR
jgi:cytochrome c oxidase subunit II